ncbi:HD domain-containing protein [Natronomonas sp.]|jgi:HD superfamily phosphodiesterase|uniref:HD domain-containing protein n=1 Tax=Natronomonas sp. TaxID=2184060 RepID=UPI003988AEEA
MDIESVFPEIESIEDDTLRTGVSTAWTTAAGVNGLEVEDLPEVPWLPPAQDDLGLAAEEALLVDHVRDVTACALGLAESLLAASAARSSRDPPSGRVSRHDDLDIDLDTVIAGALIHDVSKLYEFDGMERTEVGRLLGHPYYGVSVVSRANLPVEIAHIVLSHSPRTSVEPATLEAELVRRADEAAAASIRAGAVDDLRDA